MPKDRFCKCCKGQQSASSSAFTLPGAKPSFAPDLLIEPFHLDISLNFDLPNKMFKGDVVVSVIYNGPESLETPQLKLNAMNFQDVSVRPTSSQEIKSADLSFSYDGEFITIDWNQPFEPQEQRAFVVSYAVIEPVSGMDFNGPPGSSTPSWAITDNETERARYWLPTIDLPAVRPRLDFHLTADEDLVIVANGLRQGVDKHKSDDGTNKQTAHWKLDFPCPSYLTCLAVGKFVMVEDDSNKDFPMAWLASAEVSTDNLRRSFGKTPDMMAWMEKRLGVKFPFPKYFQIALNEVGGAMENISLVTWDDIFIVDEHFQKEWGDFTDIVNVHEMAHSYFGDAVVCRHFEHSWLKESWATYMEAVWVSECHPETTDEFEYTMYLNAQGYFGETADYSRPIVTKIYDQSWSMFDWHLYPGGAWRLHMLRKLLGEHVFWEGVRIYLEENFQKTVETDTFRLCLERASGGANLTQFFDQWIYGKNYPRIKATYSWDKKQHFATVQLEQTQKFKDTANGQPFAVTLDVAFYDTQGQEQIVSATFDEKGKTAASVKLDKAPARIWIDPNQKVLHGLTFSPGQMLASASLKSGSVCERIWAAQELCKKGDRASLSIVEKHIETEHHWGVRAQIAKALGKSQSQRSISILAQMVHTKQDDRCVNDIVRACQGKRTPEMRAALLQFLDRKDTPYRARARAYEALGTQQNPEDLATLIEGVHATMYLAISQVGAVDGLANLASALSAKQLDQVVNEVLLPNIKDPSLISGKNMISKLVGTLGTVASFMNENKKSQVVKILVDLLRHDKLPVRKAAVNALLSAKAKGVAGSLEAVRPHLPNQDSCWLDRQLEALSDSLKEEKGVQQVKKDVTALDKRIANLEQKFHKLERKETTSKSSGDTAGNSSCSSSSTSSILRTGAQILTAALFGAATTFLWHRQSNKDTSSSSSRSR